MNFDLRPLNLEDEDAFFEGMKLWQGEALEWYTFSWKEGMSYSQMLEILNNEAKGVHLAPDRVPHTMLYAFLDGVIVGRVSVRHTLNENLRQRGGHIGYAIAPKYRRQGLATQMVAKALPFCRQLGLKTILVTCSDTNLPSWKIIEAFGGKLQDTIWDEANKEYMRRYWIELEN